ncbi:MAG: hypothetical protein OXF11_19910 [Deltaproteobacteria bacterium]|nr:hypothetical protein [Deltaproteobacteria bacterium]
MANRDMELFGERTDEGKLPESVNRKQPQSSANTPALGLLLTNHLNLLYMLAAGMVMPPPGFGGKYYQDTLACCPGWIPLFLGKRLPADAVSLSTSEAEHLRLVGVEFELTGLSGTIAALGTEGTRELRFPDQLDGSESVLLIPAPLPTSRIRRIVFPSPEDKRAVETAALDFANVPLQDFKRKTVKTVFAKPSDEPWPPAQGPAERAAPLQAPLAAGGIMAMLLHFAHQGDLSVAACRTAFDPDDDLEPPENESIPAGLRAWMRAGNASSPAPDAATESATSAGLQNAFQDVLLWGAVDRLLDHKNAGPAIGAEDVLLDYLDEETPKLDVRLQAGAKKLRETLVSLRGLVDATPGELFDRHETSLARAMILFSLRNRCADLLEFRSDRLREPDWLTAAILFGAREGWMGLPLPLRAVPGLDHAATHRMAQMAHRIAGTDLDLGTPPPRVRPLREFFGDGRTWGAKENAAAIELADAFKWDCVRTRIILTQGEYKLTVHGSSVHIELPGTPGLDTKVDPERFFHHLAETRVESKVEEKVRKTLGV